jgi:hypothetical protein
MVKLPIQRDAMGAIIAFEGVTITHVKSQMDKQIYDGTVTFHAKSGGIEFTYVYQFVGASDIKKAISLGITYLNRELEQLSSATQNIQYAS